MEVKVRGQVQLQAENSKPSCLSLEAKRQAGNTSFLTTQGARPTVTLTVVSQPQAMREDVGVALKHPVSCGLCACMTIMWMAASAFLAEKTKG